MAEALAERYTDSVPFYVGAGSVLLALAVFSTARQLIDDADRAMLGTGHSEPTEGAHGLESVGGAETVPVDAVRASR